MKKTNKAYYKAQKYQISKIYQFLYPICTLSSQQSFIFFITQQKVSFLWVKKKIKNNFPEKLKLNKNEKKRHYVVEHAECEANVNFLSFTLH